MGRRGGHSPRAGSRRGRHRSRRKSSCAERRSVRRRKSGDARVANADSEAGGHDWESRMKLIECVPNFSEGRRLEVVAAIRDAIASAEGVSVLDVSSDASHNRSVITFVAPVTSAVEAAFLGIKAASERIDLCAHSGEHPRIGATDVVPFVPLEGSTMEDCIALARELGERVGPELQIPAYLYARAAPTPGSANPPIETRRQYEPPRD